ncbi:hypothetical protein ABEB36_011894 [Hypothenemus hampei]|uniref:Uncharacterized protein n=1 Tax=Hypothenemus hampei TaxID=57062 RepID=A0ABD1E9D2_HYPHA
MEKQDNKIALSNFDSICRACLLENAELMSIYGLYVENEEKTAKIELIKMFERHCDIEVNLQDEKPQLICKPCIRVFCEAYAFFDKCMRSNKILDDILYEHKPEQVKTCNELKKNPRKRSRNNRLACCSDLEEDNLGNEDDDSDWEPSRDMDDVSIKQENESELDEEDSFSEDHLEDVKSERRTTRKKLPLVAKRRGRPRKIHDHRNDSEAIENQHKELVCRLCNEILPDMNSSIDHYDELHAPKMQVDECIFCERPKLYKKRDNLLYHMGLHSKDSIKCIPCRKYFRDKESLQQHLNECFKVNSHDSIIKLESDLKSSQSNVTQLSQKELRESQYDGAFTCKLCNEKLGEIDFVISHFERDHLDDLRCIICLRAFTKQVPLFHLGLHSKKSHVCRPCRLLFRSKQEFDEHNAKYDHDNSLSCKICGKKFTRNYKKNKHMLSHLKEKNYSCNKCGKTFTYKTSLVRHFKMHFGKRFLCSSCGNAYTTKFMLQRHIKIMHTFVDDDGNPLPKPPPKPVNLQCEFCGEIFTTKYGYGRHIRRHPEFKEFKCKICSFICDTREQLDSHMESKHNKHTCEVCGKRFPFESELKTHHRKHEDIAMARFRCDVCGKTARTQTQLKVHYRIHTGERPFSCDICGKSFKQTAHLKVHMFQHTGKMPFKCKICEKSFPFQHVMEIHLRTHTGEKPFQCMFCGNAYHDRTTMQKHQKKKHPDMPVQKTNRSEYKISTLT